MGGLLLVTDAIDPTNEPASTTEFAAPTADPLFPHDVVPSRAKRAAPDPLGFAAVTLAATAAALLLGGVLFAFASASARSSGGGSPDRFRLLGQAANPFIAALALASVGLVVTERRERWMHQVASVAALGIATAVSLAIALLAVNGIITDLTAETTGLFRASAIISRLATVVLGGLAMWIAATAPAPPGSRPPATR